MSIDFYFDSDKGQYLGLAYDEEEGEVIINAQEVCAGADIVFQRFGDEQMRIGRNGLGGVSIPNGLLFETSKINMRDGGWIGLDPDEGRIIFEDSGLILIDVLRIRDAELRMDDRMWIEEFNVDNDYPEIYLNRAHNATYGTYTETEPADNIGAILFNGCGTGDDLQEAAAIAVVQTGNAAAGYIPVRMEFYTCGAEAGGANHFQLTLTSDSRIGIVTSVPDAQLDINQWDDDADIPVLILKQVDNDQPFVCFKGEADDEDLTRSIVNEEDIGSATREGWLKVYVVDSGDQITDQAYYIPIYTLSA